MKIPLEKIGGSFFQNILDSVESSFASKRDFYLYAKDREFARKGGKKRNQLRNQYVCSK